MTKKIVSMREFLRTGAFGPLTTDATLLDVARALGAPTFFSTEHAEDVPTYWGYGKLEIQFETTAPHRTDWFQIEHADELEGEFELITQNLVLALEGCDGTARPSALLSSNIWQPELCVVTIGALADDVLLNIRARNIRVVYRVDSTFISDGDAIKYVSQTGIEEIVREIDHRTEIDSIYSFRLDKNAPASIADVHAISSSRYLAALAN
ncbi:hypothetical protein ASD52_02025 [Ensifer sp. Root142]|uniref:hypothetical protein n=1 Tax=Ensifer sp. Root142 TaxID=1736461 RepID=UPI000709F820|nr:hypothetical protein [Ensifer sp. Root142]KQY78647.1 hypothetical protein ASD52_02025 [Ensifer sp. Root142]